MLRPTSLISCLVLIAAMTGDLTPGSAIAQVADLVALNGKVFTARDDLPLAEGFAVKDGRFVAVGTSSEIRTHVGARTRVIDLHGRFVTPGLADGHFHNEGGGQGVDLADTRSMAELLAAVGAAAAQAQPGDLIVSNADWHEAQLKEQRLPTARELDRRRAEQSRRAGARRP